MIRMTLLRTKDIKAMRPDELKIKFKELSDELMHERGVAAMGGAPASPGKIRAIRTNVARILTVMREQELAAEEAKAKQAPVEKKGKEAGKKAPEPKAKKSAGKPKRTAKKKEIGEEEETK